MFLERVLTPFTHAQNWFTLPPSEPGPRKVRIVEPLLTFSFVAEGSPGVLVTNRALPSVSFVSPERLLALLDLLEDPLIRP